VRMSGGIGTNAVFASSRAMLAGEGFGAVSIRSRSLSISTWIARGMPRKMS
jgi:hypothetical protein